MMARQETRKVLLVYPQHPDTFWSYKYALKFISKKASSPPLGLLTVAAMLPEDWEKRLVDTQTAALEEADIEWADYVFISAMSIQETSARQVVARCKAKGVKTVGGGPLFTSMPDAFPDVDYLVLDEAEITLPLFLKDLAQGRAAAHLSFRGLGRHRADAQPQVGPDRHEEIRLDEHPVFTGLPVQLRILQHYGPLRAKGPDEGQGPDHRRA